MKKYILLLNLISCPLWGANLMSFDLLGHLRAPRWQHGENQKVRGATPLLDLYKLKKALSTKNKPLCLAQARKAMISYREIKGWILDNYIQCGLLPSPTATPLIDLRTILRAVDRNKSLLYAGPWQEDLRKHYLEALIATYELEARGERTRAWTLFSQLREVSSWMDEQQLALVYRRAGEMAFIEQNLIAAEGYFRRSLESYKDKDLQQKISAIRSTLGLPAIESEPDKKSYSESDLELTEEEKKLLSRMQRSFKSGDLLAGVEDGSMVIRKFPGGKKADWAAHKIVRVYYQVVRKSDGKYQRIARAMLKHLLKCDGHRLAEWSNYLFAKGRYKSAFLLGEKAYEKLGALPQAEEALWNAGRAMIYLGKNRESLKYFTPLANKYAGQTKSRLALVFMGIASFKQKNYSTATAHFERYLALPWSESIEEAYRVKARYWLWRSQQKLDKARATEEAKKLIAEFPLTYYGLRAKLETQPEEELFASLGESKKVVQLWLTPYEKQRWQSLQLLLRAGWFFEAQQELDHFVRPETPSELAFMSNIYGSAFDHFKAISYINRAFQRDASFLKKEFIAQAYPKEFENLIGKEAKKQGIEEKLVLSLIKQESSFREKAKSSADAIGLMQIVRITAKDIQRDLKVKKLDFPDDLHDPQTNIRFGTHYLKKMMRAHRGNIPLALAAYNAGIGNMRKWMRTRDDFDELQENHTLDPSVEIWMDELPWEETSHYVKAIMRNLIIYRWLNNEKIVIDEKKPFWKKG